MTALTKFVISSILSFIGFAGPVESELTKQVIAPSQKNDTTLAIVITNINCENILFLSCNKLK